MDILQLKILRNIKTDKKTTRGEQHQRKVQSSQDVTAQGNRNTYHARTIQWLVHFLPVANARDPVEAAAGAVPEACPHSTPPGLAGLSSGGRTVGPSTPLPALTREPGQRQVHPLP